MPGISPEDERTVRHEQNHINSLLTIDHGVKVTDNEACSSLEWSKNGCISLMANSTTTQVSQTAVVDGEMVLICVKRSDADSRREILWCCHTAVYAVQPSQQDKTAPFGSGSYPTSLSQTRYGCNCLIPNAVI